MAALRTSLRLVPRSHLLRPSPFSRPATLLQRSYAAGAPGSRPADDRKPIEQAEEASEDFNEYNDPGMVCVAHLPCVQLESD